MNYYFDTEVQDHKVTVSVSHYGAAMPMKIIGSGMGDAIPPELEEFEFKLLDKEGIEIQMDLTDEDHEQILSDYKLMVEGDNRGF